MDVDVPAVRGHLPIAGQLESENSLRKNSYSSRLHLYSERVLHSSDIRLKANHSFHFRGPGKEKVEVFQMRFH